MVIINSNCRGILLVPVLLLIYFSTLHAQSETAVFDPASIKNFSHINGLPQNSVNDFCFDNLGFMWIATWDGLSRFDGQNFKNSFGYNSSIPLKAKVLQFFKKGTDTILALTPEQKIFIITYGKVVGYETYTAKKHGVLLRYSQEAVPYPQHINDNDLLVNTKKSITDIQYAYPGFKYNNDTFGIIGTNLTIYNKSGAIKMPALPSSNFTNALHKVENVHMLASSLAWINNATNTLDLYSVDGNVQHLSLPLRNNIPWKIYNSPNCQTLFVANNTSLFEVKASRLRDKTEFIKMTDNFKDLGHTQLIDNYDNKFLIIATQTDGIYVWHKNVVQTFQAPDKTVNVNNFYAQILLPDDKTILTGINFLFDKNGFKGIAEGISEGEKPLYSDPLSIRFLNRVLFKGSDNFYWYMRKEYDSFFLMKAPYPGSPKGVKMTGVVKEPIYNIFEDSRGNTWFNFNGSVGYLNKESGKYTTLPRDTGKNYLPAQNIRSYAEDQDHRILIGTTDGLYVYDYRQIYPRPKKYLLEGVTVHYLTFNNATGALWIGTYGKGLWILYKSGKLIQVPTDKGNSRSTIHYTVTDQYNRVWLSSNEGLYVTTKDAINTFESNPTVSPYFYKFSSYDGFAEDEFNAGCQLPMILQRDGSLTVSSIAGLAWINTNTVPLNFNGKKLATLISYGSRIEEDISTLYIEPGDNNELMIDVIAPDWGPGYNIQLEYKVVRKWENSEQLWQPVNEQHKISFPFLSAGDYEIVIRKRTGLNNNDFIYHSVMVHKKRYWYQTAFLYPILILVLIAIGYLLYLWRVATLKQKNQKLKQKIAIATADLQTKNEELSNTVKTRDSLILLFNHDLSTPLFYINKMAKEFAETEKEKGTGDGAAQLLADSTQDLEELMNDMLLWIQIQQKNAVIQIAHEPVNINELLEKTFSIFSHRLSNNRITVKLQFLDDVIINTDRRIFNSILYNIITNAIKYTRNGIVQVEKDYSSAQEGQLNLIVRSKSYAEFLPEWQPGNNYNKITSLIKEKKQNGTKEKSHQIGLQLVQHFSNILRQSVELDDSVDEIFTIIISGLQEVKI